MAELGLLMLKFEIMYALFLKKSNIVESYKVIILPLSNHVLLFCFFLLVGSYLGSFLQFAFSKLLNSIYVSNIVLKVSVQYFCCTMKIAQSGFLQPHGLWPARLLCPWNSPGKSTGMGSCSFLQGIFLTQGSDWVSSIAVRCFTV